MPTLRVRMSDFTGAEWSPRAGGRVDLERYQRSCRRLENYLLLPEGGVTRRPGTKFVAEAAGFCVMRPWEYSVADSYALEFSHGRIRFYRNSARVEVGGVPVEVETPYAEGVLRELQFEQSADTLFIVHPLHTVKILQRLSTTLWRLRDFAFRVPPTYEYGVRPLIAVTPGAVSGSGVTMTASSDAFVDGDIGRYIEVVGPTNPSLGARALITAVGGGPVYSPTCTVNITEAFASTAAIPAGDWRVTGSPQSTVTPSAAGPEGTVGVSLTANVASWRPSDVGKFVLLNGGTYEIYQITSASVAVSIIRGEAESTTGSPPNAWTLEEAAFSAQNGYPAVVGFFGDRLGFANTRAQPNTRWLSATGDYDNFAQSVLDDGAVVHTLNAGQVDAIQWLVGRKSLLTGTSGGEWVVRLADGEVLTPLTLPDRPETSFGSASHLQPLVVGNVVLFATRSRRRLRELVFSYETESYVAPNLGLLTEHHTRPIRIGREWIPRQIIDMAYQREPHPVVWIVREDGTLLGCTYLRDQNVVGWHRHVTGTTRADNDGFLFPVAQDGQIESVAVIQHPAGDREQVWVSVCRTVNGAIKRYVEVLDDTGLFYDSLNTDATSVYDGLVAFPLTPSATTGTGVTFTSGGPAFAAGDVGKEIRELGAGGRATITAYVSANQVVGDVIRDFLSTAPIVANGWGVAVFSLSGLGYLEAKTVDIVADGAVCVPQVVVDGRVTLEPVYGALQVEVGLHYDSTLITQRPEVTGAATLQGVRARVGQASVRVYETAGLWINDQLVDMRRPPYAMGAAVPLQSRDFIVPDLAETDDDAVVTIEQRVPLPQTVLLLTSKINVEDD